MEHLDLNGVENVFPGQRGRKVLHRAQAEETCCDWEHECQGPARRELAFEPCFAEGETRLQCLVKLLCSPSSTVEGEGPKGFGDGGGGKVGPQGPVEVSLSIRGALLARVDNPKVQVPRLSLSRLILSPPYAPDVKTPSPA